MNASRMKEILANEYGITTEKQLNEAIKKTGNIDIGIFTGRKVDESADTKSKAAS